MTPDELSQRLRQQSLVAEFGVFALEAGPLDRLLAEACRVAAEGLGVALAKALRHRSETDDLLMVAGVGWHAGVVGHSTLGAGLASPAGFALKTGRPVRSTDLARERRFRTPAVLIEHGARSAINVMIGRPNRSPFGVLEVESSEANAFQEADTAFLQSLANVLAAGLVRIDAETAKDALLIEKELLMREVHHRVTNSLQLVRTMLGLQARGAPEGLRGQLENAAARIMSIASVHRRLFEGGSVASGDAAVYLRGLLGDISAMLSDAGQGRPIRLDCEPVVLHADVLTRLGLVVVELVTNALKYASGEITVAVLRHGKELEVTVQDGGPGFPPDNGADGLRRGLGMRLVASLAKGEPGAAVRIDRDVPFGRISVTLAADHG